MNKKEYYDILATNIAGIVQLLREKPGMTEHSLLARLDKGSKHAFLASLHMACVIGMVEEENHWFSVKYYAL